MNSKIKKPILYGQSKSAWIGFFFIEDRIS